MCTFRAVRELAAESLNRLTVMATEYMSSNGVYASELSLHMKCTFLSVSSKMSYDVGSLSALRSLLLLSIIIC